jgi:predicted RNA-binding Zn-ribbon protein involved in translation (DUF1610 family)
MIKTTMRKARFDHDCTGCPRTIYPGETYYEHVAYPNDPDLGNEGWWRIKTCFVCEDKYNLALAARTGTSA